LNPLLLQGELPAFAHILPEHVTPALDELLAAAEAALEQAVSAAVPADYDALSAVLDVPVERLRACWNHVCHLQSVMDTPALRAAHAHNLPRVIEFTTRMGADARLYAKYKALAAGAAAPLAGSARARVLANALRDAVLDGAELQGGARARFVQIRERSADLSQRFGDHVLDATDAFSLRVHAQRMAGVPADVCQATREAAQAQGLDGHLLSLQAPCYQPVLQFADDRALREAMFRAYATRASELGAQAHDNTRLVHELLALRHEEAALLGHASYAPLALVPKMAVSPEEVLGFLRGLAARARPAAERELAELREFAAHNLGLPELQAWDRPYVSEKLKQARFDFSSQEVKQYFTEPRVLEGLFELARTLFGVTVVADAAPVWHPSVRFYRVCRGTQPVAAFYLDLHARPGKQSGAWMDDVLARWRRPDGCLQLPVAHLVCNFAPPVGGQPALLTHDDVITLFHEFGHGLHHMLTQVEELAVSGIGGVEGDAIELPSQFMENFCWEWDVLQRMSAHVQSGAPLPRKLFERMRAARNFGSGLQLLRHCEYALFDMRLHGEPAMAQRVQDLADEVCAEVQPVLAPPFMRYANSFTHLFDGGYAAGYYGYAWAEVMSADAYAAFEEAGIFDPAPGQRFLQQVLETGGSRPALDNFLAFRGRAPQVDALLRHQGLA
jgi:oligopeptidase A